MRYLIFICLFLTSCFGAPRIGAGSYRAIDPETGQEIVTALTIASDWLMYFGILFIVGGVLAIVFLKAVKTGGSCIITGFSLFIFAQLLDYIQAHIGLFTCAFIAFVGFGCFIYYKACTVGVPWLEKLANKDFNRDGKIG